MKSWFNILKEKWMAWATAHPRLINRRNGIIAACVLTALILFCPVPRELNDGGSVEYRALTYSVVRWEFFEGTGAPDPAHKITKTCFYPAPVCWTRNVWERQGDEAEKLGCFTYEVVRYKLLDQTGWRTTCLKTINGYRTYDMWIQSYDGDGFNAPASNPITLEEIAQVRAQIDRGELNPERKAIRPEQSHLLGNQANEKIIEIVPWRVEFCRVTDPKHPRFKQILPLKTYVVYSGTQREENIAGADIQGDVVYINLADNAVIYMDQMEHLMDYY